MRALKHFFHLRRDVFGYPGGEGKASQRAGVDLSRPEAVRAVVRQLDELVTQLEGILTSAS